MNSENLKEARKKSGMTQKEVADIIGVGQSTYKNYECALREPNGDTIVKLANLFNVTTDYLLGCCNDMPDPIEIIAKQKNLSPLEIELLSRYFDIPAYKREVLLQIIRNAVHIEDSTDNENE